MVCAAWPVWRAASAAAIFLYVIYGLLAIHKIVPQRAGVNQENA